MIALIGANGIGKTTLFKLIAGDSAVSGGKITYGANVKIGYFDQEYALLDSEKTIFDEISDEIKSAVDYVVIWRQDDRHPAAPSSIIKLNEDGSYDVLR